MLQNKLRIYFIFSLLISFIISCKNDNNDSKANYSNSENTNVQNLKKPDSPSINKFQVLGYNATIKGTKISLTLPNGTDLENLIPSFEFTGTDVKVNNISQKSGKTINNFKTKGELTYTVFGVNGTKLNYNVAINSQKNVANKITNFEINGNLSTITETGFNSGLIKLILPNSLNNLPIDSLFAKIETTGEELTIDRIAIKKENFTQTNKKIEQEGITRPIYATQILNIGSNYSIQVTAENGNIRTYDVYVSYALSTERSLNTLAINDTTIYTANISDNKKVVLNLPYNYLLNSTILNAGFTGEKLELITSSGEKIPVKSDKGINLDSAQKYTLRVYAASSDFTDYSFNIVLNTNKPNGFIQTFWNSFRKIDNRVDDIQFLLNVLELPSGEKCKLMNINGNNTNLTLCTENQCQQARDFEFKKGCIDWTQYDSLNGYRSIPLCSIGDSSVPATQGKYTIRTWAACGG